MTETQKLREALQAISHIDDTTNHSVDASAALDRIGQIARQALALPTQQSPFECTRSHPHEMMSPECALRTEIARLTNENARLKATPALSAGDAAGERDKVGAWQPIETAPKWESILIYQPKFNRVAISLNDGFEYKHATHWMPLPPPPSTSARDAAKNHRLALGIAPFDHVVIGIDGNAAFALVGEDLQTGEAEFVVMDEEFYERWSDRSDNECAQAAMTEARLKLELRLGRSYPLKGEV